MKKIKRLVAFLVCICFSVSMATVSVSAASPPQSVQIISTITSEANSKLGFPYVWGAKGPSSFDCSGLSYWCYKAAGVTIPTGTAYDQKIALQNNGCLVTTPQRSTGYLIFYSYGTNAPLTGIGHVSIFIGGSQIIEASSSQGVVRSTSYSSSGIVAVCRPCNWFY